MRLKIEWRVVLATALTVSLVLNIYLGAVRKSVHAPVRTDDDKMYIAKAIRWEAQREHASEELIARLLDASVVNFRKETCVQLAPAWGVAGGRTIICFDAQTARISSVDQIGE